MIKLLYLNLTFNDKKWFKYKLLETFQIKNKSDICLIFLQLLLFSELEFFSTKLYVYSILN